MIVLKIGGSLHASEHLHEWINQLAESDSHKIIIVPGGGPFADKVRVADKLYNFSSEGSHKMAVMAMQQFARMMCDVNSSLALVSSFDEINHSSKSSLVWAPYEMVSSQCSYPKDWNTTSDSLAVWLATEVSAEHLCMVKSAQIDKEVPDVLKSDLVDNYFPTALKDFCGNLHFYHASESSLFKQHLLNDKFK